MKKTLLVITWVYGSLCLQAQDSLRVLFLGNSYTYGNDLPSMLVDMAESRGRHVYKDQSTPGGYTLEGHSTDATSQAKIAEGGWDYVVMQEQSQRPSFPPGQVEEEVLPYAAELVGDVRAVDACSGILFFMTWGRENGDQGNCEFYPPLCTYEGMQERLAESYSLMAQQNQGRVAPVGEAWRRVRASYPDIGLYAGDGSHPNINGTYLATAVFYQMMFGDSLMSDYFIPNAIPAEMAAILVDMARETVFDMEAQWDFSVLEVAAGAEYSLVDADLSCTSTATNATNHQWDFGDGGVSAEANPTHNYETSGTYTVQYIASNECESDTTVFEVDAIVSASEDLDGNGVSIRLAPNPTTGRLYIRGGGIVRSAFIYDASGEQVSGLPIVEGRLLELGGFPKGLYFIRLELEGGGTLTRKVLLD